MTDTIADIQNPNAAETEVAVEPIAAPVSVPEVAAVDAEASSPEEGSTPAKGPGRRRGRGPRADGAPKANAGGAPQAKTGRLPAVLPTLEQLATLHPALFGAVFRPLKRGIFQDIQAAHPDLFKTDELKAALAFHTRSTRYLSAVAAGQQRHDLQGQPVEPMAAEHVHHALLEVFRRRQARSPDDLRPQLLARVVQAIEASGLSREAYAEMARGRDENANVLLDEALAEVRARSAKDEALLRAFKASGQSVEGFAEMYGMEPGTVQQALDRAQRVAS